MRFKLQSLGIGVAYVAIGCAALPNPTEIWASVVVTLTVLTMLVAAVASIFGRGKNRRFSGGFAFSSVAYLACAFAPGSDKNLAPCLATTKALGWVDQKLHGHDLDMYAYSMGFSPLGRTLPTGSRNGLVRLSNVSTGNIVLEYTLLFQLGHCLWALIVGCIGGMVAQFCGKAPDTSNNIRGSAQPSVG